MNTPSNAIAVVSPAVEPAPGSGAFVPPATLTREQLLSALDAQIKFNTDERQSVGWTRWAIWGALATLTWIATDLLNRQELAMSQTTLLALGVFALWRLLEMFTSLFSPSSRAIIAPTRFRIFADVISSARLELLVAVARHLVIVFALVWFGFHNLTLLWIFVVAAMLFNLLVFAYEFLPLAFPTQHKPRVLLENLPSFIAIGVLFGALFQIGLELKHVTPGLNLSEVRLAIVFNAAAHLIGWLAADVTAAPLLNHLKQIRQDLAFGRISLDEAARHAEVTLAGLKLTEALHPAVSTALTKAAELQALLTDLKELTREASGIMATMRENDHEYETNDERCAKLLKLQDRIEQELKSVSVKKAELQNAAAKLQISSRIIVMFSPESKQEVESIASKVATAIIKAQEEETNFSQQFGSLKKATSEFTQTLKGRWDSFKISTNQPA